MGYTVHYGLKIFAWCWDFQKSSKIRKKTPKMIKNVFGVHPPDLQDHPKIRKTHLLTSDSFSSRPSGAQHEPFHPLDLIWDQLPDLRWQFEMLWSPKITAHRPQCRIFPKIAPVQMAKGKHQITWVGEIPPFWRWLGMIHQHGVSELEQFPSKTDRVIPQLVKRYLGEFKVSSIVGSDLWRTK